MTELCSNGETTTRPPFFIEPRMARLSASVALAVKTILLVSFTAKIAASRSRVVNTVLLAVTAFRWADLPGLAPIARMKPSAALYTWGGFGNVVAALSR